MTQDWSNDAENSDLITLINYIKNKNKNVLIVIIFHNITVFTVLLTKCIQP